MLLLLAFAAGSAATLLYPSFAALAARALAALRAKFGL